MNQQKKGEQPQMDTDEHRYEPRSVILSEAKDPECLTPQSTLLDSSLRSE